MLNLKRNDLHGLSLSCGHTQHTSQSFLIICDARVGPTASTGTASLIFKQTLYLPPTVHPAHRWARSTVLPCGRTHFRLAPSQDFISNASSLRRRRKRSCPAARQPCSFAAPAKPRYCMARSVYRKHELDAMHCTSADAAIPKLRPSLRRSDPDTASPRGPAPSPSGHPHRSPSCSCSTRPSSSRRSSTLRTRSPARRISPPPASSRYPRRSKSISSSWVQSPRYLETIPRVFLGHVPPLTRRVTDSPQGPCLSDAYWCLQIRRRRSGM